MARSKVKPKFSLSWGAVGWQDLIDMPSKPSPFMLCITKGDTSIRNTNSSETPVIAPQFCYHRREINQAFKKLNKKSRSSYPKGKLFQSGFRERKEQNQPEITFMQGKANKAWREMLVNIQPVAHTTHKPSSWIPESQVIFKTPWRPSQENKNSKECHLDFFFLICFCFCFYIFTGVFLCLWHKQRFIHFF